MYKILHIPTGFYLHVAFTKDFEIYSRYVCDINDSSARGRGKSSFSMEEITIISRYISNIFPFNQKPKQNIPVWPTSTRATENVDIFVEGVYVNGREELEVINLDV